MSDPPNNSSQFGHSFHDTTLALASSDLGSNHSEEGTSGNSYAAVNATLSLNSASTIQSQNQTSPQLDQLVSYHHVDKARIGGSNSRAPCGFPIDSISRSLTIPPQSTVNLNIYVADNNSVNINLLSNKPPSQFTGNNPFATSSSTNPARKIVYNSASSNNQQPYIILDSNQETILNRNLERNESPHKTRHHSQHASGKTLSTYVTDHGQEIPKPIPCFRKNTATLFPHQRQPPHPCQRFTGGNQTISRSGMGLSLLDPPPGFSHVDPPPGFSRADPPPGFSHVDPPPPGFSHADRNIHHPVISTMKPTKDQILVPNVRNGMLHESLSHVKLNLPTFPKIRPPIKEVRKQAPKLNFEPIILPRREPLQGLSQVPSQNDNRNPRNEFNPQARRSYRSPRRFRSDPYIKNGPYTCPQCHVVMVSSQRFAAHCRSHYKDEAPSERPKWPEREIRNPDVHIAQSTGSMTAMPGPSQLENAPLVAAQNIDGKAERSVQGEDVASRIITEEV